MYGRKANSELKQSELEEAQRGFIQFLRRKRFSPQFIASHGDDLFATAALEYSRKVAEGEEIDSPAGWLITCAWRRTKSLLEAEGRSPQIVSTDKAEAIEDELGRTPEDVTLDEDRLRKVQEAVDQLSVEEQRLLELAYFEGMAVREAARELHWHPSKAQRCHEAAREHLHQLLGVDSLDELEIIVGLAAYISLVEKASAPHLPAGVEAVAETVSRGIGHGWARAQDLARRLPFGGGAEPSATAALGGSAGRAAGVCATAALACLASGVVGPGVGGVIGGGGGASGPAPKQRNVADAPRVAPLTPRTNPAPSSSPEAKPSPTNGNKQRGGGGSATASAEHTRHATEAVASQSLESAAGGSETSSAPVESAPVTESSPPSSSASSSGSTPTQVANQQFGP
ncbi:MAG TPA: sigma-70 family RNA polymerase sigma factor [Solirubrobacterales bacterium]|jgi:RNA polymerase sigma factor (sigma-70 family)|nr:sigma-70 family RNA polymerase sigma factor [Solirubrobacterales bacterium]